jgi:hypothetical protein
VQPCPPDSDVYVVPEGQPAGQESGEHVAGPDPPLHTADRGEPPLNRRRGRVLDVTVAVGKVDRVVAATGHRYAPSRGPVEQSAEDAGQRFAGVRHP